MRISKRWGIGAGLALIGAGMILQALIPSFPMTMLEGAALDAGHFFLFAVLAVAVLRLVAWGLPGRRGLAFATAVAAAVFLGLATEFAQYFTGRDAGLMDFVRDLLGAGAALLLAFAFGDAARAPERAGAILLALALSGAALFELAHVWHDYRARNAAFPSIADFDAGWESRFVHGHGASLRKVDPPEGWTAHGQVGELVQGEGPWPGIGIREPFPDWSGYGAFEFRVWSAEPGPAEFTVRVHDFAHDDTYVDRFNQRLEVLPGENLFRIGIDEIRHGPRDRELDLGAIAGIAFFSGPVERPRTLWLDGFRLVEER